MVLTREQDAAIQKGEPILLEIGGIRCVLIREDVYEQARESVESSPRETYSTVLKALDRDDESPDQHLEYLDE
ncbi:MAG: hypothetical protein WD069_06540 [Planctomycetales bacterium]